MNHKLLSILQKQGDIAAQIDHIITRRARGELRFMNVDTKYMEPDALINFHWKRIEFLEWLKPLQKEQIQVILQEMQSTTSEQEQDLQLAKTALVKDLLLNMKDEI